MRGGSCGEHWRAGAPRPAGPDAPPGGNPAAAREDPPASGPATDPRAYEGWRAWRVKDGMLWAVTSDTAWPVNMALDARDKGPWVWLSIHALGVVGAAYLTAGAAQADNTFGVLVFGGSLAILGIGVGGALTGWLRRRSTGQMVAPGMMTPGIYALHRMEDVEGGDFTDPGEILVRGKVALWGDTLDHQRGCKGQYAYPLRLTDVECARCGRWMPIEEYHDETAPPHHAVCPPAPRWNVRGRFHARVSAWRWGNLRRRWRSAGLRQLRASAPQWFKA